VALAQKVINQITSLTSASGMRTSKGAETPHHSQLSTEVDTKPKQKGTQ
jgi:hypothetical protein